MAIISVEVPDKIAAKFSHTNTVSIITLYREYRNLDLSDIGKDIEDEECFDKAVRDKAVR